ncbi:hypothetical protein V8G54_035020 [Vigna mungo]|uniref:Uncharacterized protein n=1 Tax=Vigna mungo TaxID=3915 RepID=A0AAQ3ME94_VIGMU
MITTHFLIMLNHQNLTCFMSLFLRFLCSHPIKLSNNNHHLVVNHIMSSHPGMCSNSCHTYTETDVLNQSRRISSQNSHGSHLGTIMMHQSKRNSNQCSHGRHNFVISGSRGFQYLKFKG